MNLCVGFAHWKHSLQGGEWKKKNFLSLTIFIVLFSSTLSHGWTQRRFRLEILHLYSTLTCTRDDSASTWRIFYIPHRKRWLGQKLDAAKKWEQLWILTRWNFNLWIFPPFPSESKDKPRDVTSLDLDKWKTICAFSAVQFLEEVSYVVYTSSYLHSFLLFLFISFLLLFSVYFCLILFYYY